MAASRTLTKPKASQGWHHRRNTSQRHVAVQSAELHVRTPAFPSLSRTGPKKANWNGPCIASASLHVRERDEAPHSEDFVLYHLICNHRIFFRGACSRLPRGFPSHFPSTCCTEITDMMSVSTVLPSLSCTGRKTMLQTTQNRSFPASRCEKRADCCICLPQSSIFYFQVLGRLLTLEYIKNV